MLDYNSINRILSVQENSIEEGDPMSAESFNRRNVRATAAGRAAVALARIRRHAPAKHLRAVTDMDGSLLLNARLPHCRVCGCTEINACPGAFGGCYWVEPDLCSACAPDDHPGLIRVKGGGIVR